MTLVLWLEFCILWRKSSRSVHRRNAEREREGEREKVMHTHTHKGCISHFQAKCEYAAMSHKIWSLESDPKNHTEMANVNIVVEADCVSSSTGTAGWKHLDIRSGGSGGVHMPPSAGSVPQWGFLWPYFPTFRLISHPVSETEQILYHSGILHTTAIL